MTSKLEMTCQIHWADVPKSGVNKKLSATQKECQDLAGSLGVLAFQHVEADFKITRWRSSGLKLIADIRAEVVQNCVVSLETVSSSLDEQMEWHFLPVEKLRKDADTEIVLQIDPLGDDPADALVDGKVDLGTLVAEHLCLMIDPFVRASAVEFDDVFEDVKKSHALETAEISPFAVLDQLRKKS